MYSQKRMWRSKERCTNVRVFINVYHWSRFCALLQDMNLMIHKHTKSPRLWMRVLLAVRIILITYIWFWFRLCRSPFFQQTHMRSSKYTTNFVFRVVFFFGSWCVLAKTTCYTNDEMKRSESVRIESIISEKLAKETAVCIFLSFRISLSLFLSHPQSSSFANDKCEIEEKNSDKLNDFIAIATLD